MLTFACFVKVLYVNVKILFIPATMNIKMLVSLAKLLNERLFFNKLERCSIMTKIMHIFMKQPSLLWVCSQ
jgi:hypothetical protein